MGESLAGDYCTAFYAALISAEPPCSDWPTDLGVPFTDFSEIVTTLEPWSLQAIGRVALNSLGDAIQQDSLQMFADELEKGRCVLMQDGEGSVERIVSFTSLVLSRSDGCFLVQLAKYRFGMLEVSGSLPHCKQTNGVSPPMAVERLLRERFHSIADLINLGQSEVLVQRVQANMAKGEVHTKYIRTIMHGVLELGHDEVDDSKSGCDSESQGMSQTLSNYSGNRPRVRLVSVPTSKSILNDKASLRTQISLDSERSSPRISIAHVREPECARWSGLKEFTPKPRATRFTQWTPYAVRKDKEKERDKDNKKSAFSFCDQEAFKDDHGHVYVWLTGKQFDDLQLFASHQTVTEWIAALERRHEELRQLSAPVTVSTVRAL